MKRNYAFSLCVLGVLFLSSCNREPLYDEIGSLLMEIAIDYNIKHTPDYPEPELMFVGLYSPENGTLLHTEFTGPSGGNIFADPGYYDFLVYNFDTEVTLIRNNDNFNNAEAYTEEVSNMISQEYRSVLNNIKENNHAPSRVGEYEGQVIIKEPDHLFSGVDIDRLVPVRGNTGEVFVIETNASTLLETYSLTIGPITGMEYIASMEVFITGQAQSKLLASRKITGKPVTLFLPIEMNKKSRSDMLNATFNTFGKFPGTENKVFVVVKIEDLDGNITIVEADVTSQFDDSTNSEGDIVIVQPIEIDPTQGGGLAPSVTIWDNYITDIPII